MRHKRNIIFKSRFGWEDYGQDEEYVRFLTNTLPVFVNEAPRFYSGG